MINLILSLLLIIPLVLQENILFLFLQFITMIYLAYLRKKRVKLLPSFFVTISLVFFSLLSPFGKILFSFGKFTITEGALILGLKKSFVLCGMVFISQIATSFELKIKGNFGKMISGVFYWFNIFSSIEKEDRKKMGLNLKSIDEYLCKVYFSEETIYPEKTIHQNQSPKREKIWLGILIFANVIFYTLFILKKL